MLSIDIIDISKTEINLTDEGKLTFRKFAVGTMQTPLHRLKDDQFETAIHEMIFHALCIQMTCPMSGVC